LQRLLAVLLPLLQAVLLRELLLLLWLQLAPVLPWLQGGALQDPWLACGTAAAAVWQALPRSLPSCRDGPLLLPQLAQRQEQGPGALPPEPRWEVPQGPQQGSRAPQAQAQRLLLSVSQALVPCQPLLLVMMLGLCQGYRQQQQLLLLRLAEQPARLQK
jgi:hypothetical protein